MNKSYRAGLLSWAAAGVLILAYNGPALAQATPGAASAEGGGIEVVTVTAQRRGSEDISSVPMAVRAFSGDTLQKLHVQSVQDLSKVDPSLNVISYGAAQQQIVIRGISSNVGQTTGLYLDEAPLLGGFNGNVPGDSSPGLRLHDLDHIEVLSGPQGTLFGSASMDGTVRAITNKPNLEYFSGSIDASAATVHGGDGYFDGDAVVNVPVVSDQLGVRLVGWGETGGGFIDQTIEGVTSTNVNDVNLLGGRATVLWRPIDRLSVTASINYQKVNVEGAQYWTQRVGFVGPGGPDGLYPPYQDHMAVQAPYRDQYSLYDLTAQYDTGVGSIVASTTFGKKKLVDTEDTSAMSCLYGLCRGTPIYPSIYRSDVDFSDWTDEVRFSSDFSGPLQLVAGAYYEQDIKDYSGAVLVGHQATGIALCDNYVACADGGFIQPGFGNNPVVYAFNEHFNVNQYAFYGQLDYQILPDLTATVGARYFGAHLSDQQLQQQDVYPDFIFGLVTTPYYRPRLESNESKTTYNFALLWKATSDVSLYARVASGFRIGGINNAAALAAQQGVILPTSYAPDSLWDYEGGAKIFLIDRTLFLDFSAFHIDWNNQQLNALAFGTYNYEINAGKTTTNGVSLSATYQPGGGLTLSGNINYVDAKLATDLPANVVDGGTPGLDGDRVPNVPHWSFAGHAEYDRPLCEQLIGYVGTDFNYRGDSSTAFRPVTPAQAAAGIPDNFAFHIPSYFLLNFRAGVRFDRYDVSVFTQNVTNKIAYAGVLSDLSGTRVYSVPPRTIGVRLSAAF